MIRVPSPLDEQTEQYLKQTMDCGFAVHKALGPGFFEPTYQNAFCLELTAQNIPFECQKTVTVYYRDRPVAVHRLDLVVRGCIVVEVKAVKALKKVHEAQVLAYLKASQIPVGLLMNFGGPLLKDGLRRIVLSSAHANTGDL
jgi:GxxExxY protein